MQRKPKAGRRRSIDTFATTGAREADAQLRRSCFGARAGRNIHKERPRLDSKLAKFPSWREAKEQGVNLRAAPADVNPTIRQLGLTLCPRRD
jgi:hypothetical protein